MDLTVLPQLADLLQKAGVIGVLLLVCLVLAWEVVRLRKQAVKIFNEREAFRMRYVLYKTECVRNNLRVDESALAELPGGVA